MKSNKTPFIVALFVSAFSANAADWTHAGSTFDFRDIGNWTGDPLTQTVYIGQTDSGLEGGELQWITFDGDVTTEKKFYIGGTGWKSAVSLNNVATNMPLGIKGDGLLTIGTTEGDYSRGGNVVSVQDFKGSFTFDCDVKLTSSATPASDNRTVTSIKAGSTSELIFADGHTLDFSASTDTTVLMVVGTTSASDEATGGLYINSKIITTNKDITIKNYEVSGITQYNFGHIVFGGSEDNDIQTSIWLNMDLELNKSNGAKAFSSKYGNKIVHDGTKPCTTIKYLQSNQLEFALIRMNASSEEGGKRTGKLDLNGNDSIIGCVEDITVYGRGYLCAAEYIIDFGANSNAQVFAVNSLTASGFEDLSMLDFSIYNFGEDDTFSLGSQFSDEAKTYITFYSDDGKTAISWDDFVETFDVETGYYSYSLIPEPSFMALLFGAFAAGFVALRRRK